MLNDKEIVKRVQKIGKVQSIEAEKITAFYKFIRGEGNIFEKDKVTFDRFLDELLKKWVSDTSELVYLGDRYYIFTEDEATDYAYDGAEELIESLPTKFLMKYIPLDEKGINAIKSITDEYIRNTPIILKQLVKADKKNFIDYIENAIDTFGRVYFITENWDEKEYKENVNGTPYYIYKMN